MIRALQSDPLDFNVIGIISDYNKLKSNTRLRVYFMWFPILLYPLPYYIKAYINKSIWMCFGSKEALLVCFEKIILFYIDVSTLIRLGTPYLDPAHTLLLLYLNLKCYNSLKSNYCRVRVGVLNLSI